MKRLAASLEIAGRDNGYPAGQRQDIVVSAVAAYRQAMCEFAELHTLQVWYALAEMEALQARLAPQLDRSRRKNLARTVSTARTKDHLGGARPVRRDQRGPPAHRRGPAADHAHS